MEYRTRKIVMPAQLNPGQSLFGGQALAWIDEEAGIFARCKLEHTKLLTRHMSEINFLSPAKLGDVIEIGLEEVSIGRSSYTMRCEMRNKTTKKPIVIVEKIVFVTVDENENPMRHCLSITK